MSHRSCIPADIVITQQRPDRGLHTDILFLLQAVKIISQCQTCKHFTLREATICKRCTCINEFHAVGREKEIAKGYWYIHNVVQEFSQASCIDGSISSGQLFVKKSIDQTCPIKFCQLIFLLEQILNLYQETNNFLIRTVIQ